MIKKYKLPFLVALMVAMLALLMLFYTGSYYYNLICQIACYFIVCVGLNFITGLTGQPMLGMAGVFALGSYTSAILTTKLGFTPWLAIPAVLLVGLLIGLVLGYPSLRVEGVYLSLTTIGFSEIVRIMMTNLTSLTGGGTGIKNIPNYAIFGHVFATAKEKLMILIPFAIFIAFLANKIIRSKWGRSFVAIRDNIEAVPSCGMNMTRVKLTAFILATMIGSFGGSIYAHMMNYINPSTYSQTLSVTFVSMLVIGGMGSIWGCLIGSTVVVCLPEMLRFTGKYYDFVYGIIVLLFIVFMPGGLIHLFKPNEKSLTAKDLGKIFVGGRR